MDRGVRHVEKERAVLVFVDELQRLVRVALSEMILVVALHLPGVQALVLGEPGGEWAFAIGVALVVVALATLCHVVVERPGIEMGRSVSSWLTDSMAMGRGSFMPPRAGIQFLRR